MMRIFYYVTLKIIGRRHEPDTLRPSMIYQTMKVLNKKGHHEYNYLVPDWHESLKGSPLQFLPVHFANFIREIVMVSNPGERTVFADMLVNPVHML